MTIMMISLPEPSCDLDAHWLVPAHAPAHLNSLQSVSEPMRGRLSGTRPLLLAAAFTASSVISGWGAGAAPALLLALLLFRSSPTISGCGVGVRLLLSAAAASGWVVGAGRASDA